MGEESINATRRRVHLDAPGRGAWRLTTHPIHAPVARKLSDNFLPSPAISRRYAPKLSDGETAEKYFAKLVPHPQNLTDTALVPGLREVRSRPSFRMPGRRPAWPRSVGRQEFPSSKPVPVRNREAKRTPLSIASGGETGGPGTLLGARSRTLNRSLAMELRPLAAKPAW